jgi:hypothetical protein
MKRIGSDEEKELSEELSSPERTTMGGVIEGYVGEVHKTLRALYTMRMELDRDIEALKRTAEILEDSYP